MACQSILKQSLITTPNLEISTVASLAWLSALSPLAPAALASPWLTRAHHIIPSHQPLYIDAINITASPPSLHAYH